MSINEKSESPIPFVVVVGVYMDTESLAVNTRLHLYKAFIKMFTFI